ncbi:hypothetical protein TNCV_2187441 [Trichonephila clavipes]|nr:hypothetical protein TNCV_2187441 [Trichonephila clavipes]
MTSQRSRSSTWGSIQDRIIQSLCSMPSQFLASLYPDDTEVTEVVSTPISGFKVHRTRGDKDQWPNSTPSYIQTEGILRHQRLVYPEPVVVKACTTRFRLAIDRENKQAKEAIQSDGQRTFEHCVPRVVAHYPVGIWLMASAECMKGPRAPTSQRCSAGCSVYCQCVLEGCGSGIQYHSNHDTGCRTMHNTTVQRPLIMVSPNWNSTIVMLQERKGFVCKHNVVRFHCPCPPFIAPLACGFQSSVNKAMDALQTFHFAANGVDLFGMWLRDPSLPCAQSAYRHGQWCNEVGAIGHVGQSFPPAPTNGRSAS